MKQIKDLTEDEALAICLKHDMCLMCPLGLHGGNCCIRKGIYPYIPKDIAESYLNQEIDLNKFIGE